MRGFRELSHAAALMAQTAAQASRTFGGFVRVASPLSPDEIAERERQRLAAVSGDKTYGLKSKGRRGARARSKAMQRALDGGW